MSDLPATPPDAEAQRLRQLGAAYLALQEARQWNRALEMELRRMRASRSWRITAPLRRFRAWWGGESVRLPELDPAHSGADPAALVDPGELLRHCLNSQGARQAPPGQASARLYVDVTELDRVDHGAGVQRVVRRILGQWLLEPPTGFRVEPVRLCTSGTYVHARAFLARLLGMGNGQAGADLPLMARPGDKFLGLDLIRDRADLARPALAQLRAEGVEVSFVIYDLLPLQRADWFPPGVSARFNNWFDMVVALSDRLLCISESVAAQLRTRMAEDARERLPRVFVFPLGSDPEALACANLRRAPRQGDLARVLMVGTIEPRKGHAQALAAFDLLWQRGHALELVIAGRPGWAPPALLERLRGHPEANRRLHWLDDADDAALLACYRESDLLLAASEGEGYGLPLVEAASQGLPILARDLAVFREVAGAGADYFRGDSAEELAAAIEDWLARRRQGRLADPAQVRGHDWHSSANRLKEALLQA